MPIFQGHWFNLELDRVTLQPLIEIELRAWFASTSLPKVNEKGNNNTARRAVPISRSTNYALLLRVDSNHRQSLKANCSTNTAITELLINCIQPCNSLTSTNSSKLLTTTNSATLPTTRNTINATCYRRHTTSHSCLRTSSLNSTICFLPTGSSNSTICYLTHKFLQASSKTNGWEGMFNVPNLDQYIAAFVLQISPDDAV